MLSHIKNFSVLEKIKFKKPKMRLKPLKRMLENENSKISLMTSDPVTVITT